MYHSYLKYLVLCAFLTILIPVSAQAEAVAGDATGIYRFHGNVEGAGVYIDGELKGVIEKGILDVPFVLNNPPYRSYTLQKEGYYTYNGVINSVPMKGQVVHIYVSMSAMPLVEYSKVHLLVTPTDADVTWDGNPAGKVPPSGILILYNVLPGRHTVTITKEGYLPVTQTVNVAKNDLMRVPVTLQPIPLGSISVTSVPAGASVILDNQVRGVTPLTLTDIPAGSHSIIIRGEGYQEVISSVTVTGGNTTVVSETLLPGTPVPGRTRAPIPSLLVIGALAGAGMILGFRRE